MTPRTKLNLLTLLSVPLWLIGSIFFFREVLTYKHHTVEDEISLFWIITTQNKEITLTPWDHYKNRPDLFPLFTPEKEVFKKIKIDHQEILLTITPENHGYTIDYDEDDLILTYHYKVIDGKVIPTYSKNLNPGVAMLMILLLPFLIFFTRKLLEVIFFPDYKLKKARELAALPFDQ